METTSFVLGIVTVITLAMIVGMVWTIVQVAKLSSNLDSTNRAIEENHRDSIEHTESEFRVFRRQVEQIQRDLETDISRINMRISDQVTNTDSLVDKIYSTMDSRLDKLESKVTKKQTIVG